MRRSISMKGNVKIKKDGKFTKLYDLFVRYIALKVYTRNQNTPGMYRNLQKLKPMYKNKPSYYYRLSKLAYQQKMWKQSLDYIDTAIGLSNDNSVTEFHLFKANILIHLGESSKAISCLNKYLATNPTDAQAWSMLANEYMKISKWEKAIDSLKTHLKWLPKESTSMFQLAECYRNLNDYQKAEIYYKKTANNIEQQSNRQLVLTSYYWLGCMQIINNPDRASKSFEKVIKLDRELKSQRFGIGVFHEQYKQWDYAIEAYKEQLLNGDEHAELYFKLASLLDKLYMHEEALKYYEKALELDKVRSEWHYSLALCYEKTKDYQNAMIWYRSAIARKLQHSPGYYRRLGFVLDQLGELREALVAYKEAELFNKPNVINNNFYKKNIKKSKVRYAISYEHYSINNNMVFYESLSGARMMGNPYSIFESIVNDNDFNNFIHVWVVNSFQVIPDEFRSMNNIIFVKKDSDAYFKYITSAKYLICNSTFQPYVVRKKDQLYLQTSHGIFYKTVGRDSASTPIGVAGSTRNLLQATHIIVPNEYMAEKQPKSYSIKGINNGEIAKIGYPRIDVTLNATEEDKQKIISKLQVTTSKKIVLYAPTWRGSTKSDNRFDSTKLIYDLKMLAELDANIVFRGHTITNKLLKGVEIPDNVIIPPPDIQTNELLSVADVLISDYSSVFFDYLVTEKPVIHYLYDVDVYTKERGLNLSEDELPGTVAKNSEQLVYEVANKLKNDKPSSHYLAVKNRFCPYDDGRSAERIIKWLFYDDYRNISFVNHTNNANSYLYLGGKLTGNIEIPKFVDKLNELQQNGDVISLLLSHELSKDKKIRSMLSKVNLDVNLIVHDKNMPTTLEEAFAINYYESNGKFINNRMETSYKQVYKREGRRLFGDSQFDQIVNCENDSSHYNALGENILTKNTCDS